MLRNWARNAGGRRLGYLGRLQASAEGGEQGQGEKGCAYDCSKRSTHGFITFLNVGAQSVQEKLNIIPGLTSYLIAFL